MDKLELSDQEWEDTKKAIDSFFTDTNNDENTNIADIQASITPEQDQQPAESSKTESGDTSIQDLTQQMAVEDEQQDARMHVAQKTIAQELPNVGQEASVITNEFESDQSLSTPLDQSYEQPETDVTTQILQAAGAAPKPTQPPKPQPSFKPSPKPQPHVPGAQPAPPKPQATKPQPSPSPGPSKSPVVEYHESVKKEKEPLWKNVGAWILILGGIILIFILLFGYYKSSEPPSIVFLDAKTNEPIAGLVFLDGEQIGEFDGSPFVGLPREFCEGNHDLALKKGQYTYAADAYPGDCEFSTVTYYITVKEVGVTDIKLSFIAEDTGENLGGELFIDDISQGIVASTKTISLAECKAMRDLRMVIGDTTVRWTNDPARCAEVSDLEFTVESLS